MAYSQQYERTEYDDCEYGSTYCNEQQFPKYNDYSTQGSYGRQRIPQGQIVRVCCKANPDYALGVRDGKVMLVYYNPSDPTQQWVKDETWSNRVRDEVGHPAFCLVNKATGQALRHAPAACREVLLSEYEAGSFDESVMWSESEDMGYGYRTVRMANNIGLNLDAFQADRKHGGVREGTHAVLWKWNKQENQLWKLSPCY
uniref:TSA: Wollemia nobilis Ref_Wollemi_Transcript_22057_846 transcribed RNA sequence n=1 Tax=Wollemia nobilis TaxID=56998 RepID=A0A0C9S4Z6_9CONI